MFELSSADDLILLQESFDVECKLANGRDGKGKLPEDFWPTYSAFANTRGGVIILGLKEFNQNFELSGIKRPGQVKSELFNCLNNPQKFSANVISENNVTLSNIDGHNIISIYIPQARRAEKPVFINNNPMTGTFRRLHDGDRRCDAAAVQRMFAEKEDSRDDDILSDFSVDDFDPETVAAYRNSFRAARPSHAFIEQDDARFLRSMSATRYDRRTGKEGPTAAGILMFGRYGTIHDLYSNYLPDYQEQLSEDADVRWTDRITYDGTWSGNLFDFYLRVYRKLVSDLRTPFSLKGWQRQGETPIHEALREALVNVFVHADYNGRSSLLIIKKPTKFVFRNPGLMRVPPEIAVQGGDGDARNRRLQHMFYMIGAADRAGSGIPKIYRNWQNANWRLPAYEQLEEPAEQTRLELSMIDFLPAEQVEHLRSVFGDEIDSLDREQRLVLALAAAEGIVYNNRMRAFSELHPSEITRNFQNLVERGFLIKGGRTSGTYYQLSKKLVEQTTTEVSKSTVVLERGNNTSLSSVLQHTVSDSSGSANQKEELIREDPGSKREDLGLKREDLGRKRDDLGSKRDDLDLKHGGIAVQTDELDEGPNQLKLFQGEDEIVETADVQFFYSVEEIDIRIISELKRIAGPISSKGKVSPEISRSVIVSLCSNVALSAKVISHLIGRNEAHVRNRIISPMIDAGLLIRVYQEKVNDPRQAYTSADGRRL